MGFLPLARPPTLPFFACMPSFTPEYGQSSPAAARIRSEPGARYARNPGIQTHISRPGGTGSEAVVYCCDRFFRLAFPRMSPVMDICRPTTSCCVLSSHDCPCSPSLSAMMEHTSIPIMPDCHGRLFCFAVKKSVTPRGDQIPVIEFQTTAPPSRVNFREIRGPGVFT